MGVPVRPFVVVWEREFPIRPFAVVWGRVFPIRPFAAVWEREFPARPFAAVWETPPAAAIPPASRRRALCRAPSPRIREAGGWVFPIRPFAVVWETPPAAAIPPASRRRALCCVPSPRVREAGGWVFPSARLPWFGELLPLQPFLRPAGDALFAAFLRRASAKRADGCSRPPVCRGLGKGVPRPFAVVWETPPAAAIPPASRRRALRRVPSLRVREADGWEFPTRPFAVVGEREFPVRPFAVVWEKSRPRRAKTPKRTSASSV